LKVADACVQASAVHRQVPAKVFSGGFVCLTFERGQDAIRGSKTADADICTRRIHLRIRQRKVNPASLSDLHQLADVVEALRVAALDDEGIAVCVQKARTGDRVDSLGE